MQLAVSSQILMQKYEKQYEKTSTQGPNFENEMAKIINRYVNEGKPDKEVKKEKGKVSFDESGSKNHVPSNKI